MHLGLYYLLGEPEECQNDAREEVGVVVGVSELIRQGIQEKVSAFCIKLVSHHHINLSTHRLLSGSLSRGDNVWLLHSGL